MLLTEFDYEQSQLEFANAEAQVIGSQVALENARIAMDDTDVRAPITGTIILKNVETGTVISSPTQDVSGGTVLLQMADLTSVQVRTLVDETDIGKIRPGMATRVTVTAYPNQPFRGEVLKIEPQAIIEQNVTMFPVLIRLANPGGLLKPGMNAEVDIEIASRSATAAVPTVALRAESDIPVSALMLGLAEEELRTALGRKPDSGPAAMPGAAAEFDADRMRDLVRRRRNGETLTAAEQAQLDSMLKARRQNGGGAGNPGSALEYRFGSDYWVVVVRDGEPVPTPVRTGLTDLRYSEVIDGLQPADRVLLLPSASLFEQQEMLRQFISARFGSSLPFQSNRNRTGGSRAR